MTAPDKTEALVRAMADCIGLGIPDPALPGVVAYFATATDHASTLNSVVLDDSTLELAPVFRLPETPEDDV